MKLSARPASALALALAVAGWSLAGSASQPPPATVLLDPLPRVFTDVVDVEVVNVEVVVTGRSGRPIVGLTTDDFEIFEDGRPVEITNFYEVAGGRRVGAAGRAPAPADSASAYGPRDEPLHLAVVIDDANLAPANRRKTLDDLAESLGDVLRPGDRMMVAVLASGLRVAQPFTDSVEPVLEELREIGRSAPSAIGLELRRRQVIDSVNRDDQYPLNEFSRISRFDLAKQGLNQIRSYAAEADAHNRRTLDAIEGLVGSLSGVEGRRAILYVSDGFETRPAEPLLEFWSRLFADVALDDPALDVVTPESAANRWDAETELRRLATYAAAEGVTFYTFDAGGPVAIASAVDGAGLVDATIARDQSAGDPLLHLASTTGGYASLSAQTPDALLARIEADHDDYYSLGYVSPAGRDEREHRIEVRVPGKEVRLRYPRAYRAKGVEQRMWERALSALLLEAGENPMGVRVRLGPERRGEEHGWVVPVLVTIPISNVLLVPQEQLYRHEGKVTIYLALRDERGRVSEPRRVDLPVVVPSSQLEEARGKEVGYGVNLRVRPGDGKLAVSVRDEIAGTTSSVHLPLMVGGAA